MWWPWKKKTPVKEEPVAPELSEKDKLQGLFMKMHSHYQNGAFERAKETQGELKELMSKIRADAADSARSIRA